MLTEPAAARDAAPDDAVAVVHTSRGLRGTRSRDVAVAVGLAVVVALVYRLTMLPGTVAVGDTPKFQFVGYVLGTPHPTGYPLYMVLLWIMQHVVPIGSLAHRANLLSVAAGAGTVVALYAGFRVLRVHWAVAAIVATTFGVTRTFWSQAIIAEVYTLMTLFMAVVLVCFLQWHRSRDARWFMAGTAVFALALGHQLSIALFAPALCWFVWLHRKEILKPRYFVWVAGCAVLAVAQYGYLWWRTRAGSPYLETTVRSVGDLVRVWRGGQFQGDMWAFGPVAFVTDRLPMLGRLAIREWALLLVPAVLGVVVQWRRERSVAVFLLLAVALPTFFALEYDIGDLDPYFVTLWLAVAYFVAVACDAAHNWCRERSRALGTAALVAAVFVPIAFVAWNWSAVDRRDDVHTMEKWAQVADTLPRGSYVVSTDYATSEVIWYYQFGERRGDVGAMTLDPKTAAAAVEAYVRNGTPLTGPITGTIPAGKRLYLADPEVQRELTERGVQLAPAPNQWVLEVRP